MAELTEINGAVAEVLSDVEAAFFKLSAARDSTGTASERIAAILGGNRAEEQIGPILAAMQDAMNVFGELTGKITDVQTAIDAALR